MSRLLIEGGARLSGFVPVDGAKNAALPALAASLLTDEPVVLSRVPHLRDVAIILDMIEALGKGVVRSGDSVEVLHGTRLRGDADYRYVQQMRASFLVLGPLVTRLGRAVVPLPGGCSIGPRPIDLHLKGLERLGARVRRLDGSIEVSADRLVGAPIRLAYPSVGATEQLLMAAALADGDTTLAGAAVEPEVLDLAALLQKMGARVSRRDTTFLIRGVPELGGARHRIIPDRIEATTYLLAAGITRGEVTVGDARPDDMQHVLATLRSCGGEVTVDGSSVGATFPSRPRPLDLSTAPHPGFPTDLQPPLIALLCLAEGTSCIRDTVFPERFAHTRELQRLGADLAASDGVARVRGVASLRAATVSVPDLRGGAALVLAALAAHGTTDIRGVECLARGYADLAGKLTGLGATIEHIPTS